MSSVFTQFRKTLRDFGLEWFSRYYATYRGYVVRNDDPEGQGRLMLKIPAIYGDNIYQYWAWPVGQFAGKNIGFWALPNEGDMVWVRFENGDCDFPIWEYGHWNKVYTKPTEAKTAKQKVFQTTSGMRMVFDDEKEKIVLWKKGKRVIEINDKGISIGSEGKSQYHAVLGEIEEEVLNDLRDDLETLSQAIKDFCTAGETAASSMAPLAPLIPAFTLLLQVMAQLLIRLELLKEKIPTIKSEVVTLDK